MATRAEMAGRMPLRRRSVIGRWMCLAVALLWALGFALFVFRFHLDEPHGVLTVSTGGHTFVGDPPALTLYQRDGPIWLAAISLVGLVLGCGVTDLASRTLRQRGALGVVAIVAGCLLFAYSLFGLVYGLLGIGTIAVLVILSGLPVRSDTDR